MAARHRDQIPPYEIMAPRQGASSPSGLRSRRSGSSWEAGEAGVESSSSFWHAASKPLVLRVPRGLGVLILIAALGVMVMAYWVGHNRGQAAGSRQLEHQLNQLLPRPGLPSPPDGALVGGMSGASEGALAGSGEGGQALKVLVGESDPRQVGHNYLILARYPIDEAQRLVKFLTTHQLDAFIVPSNNTRLVRVVAARGFPSGQWQTQDRSDYENQLRRAGRQWQTEDKGRGIDLSGMYGEKYKGN
jgi:hypothetical protein